MANNLASFSGSLSLITMYDRAQTPGEIMGDYQAGRAGLLPGGATQAVVGPGVLAPATLVNRTAPLTLPSVSVNEPVINELLYHFTDTSAQATTNEFAATVVWGDGKSNFTGDPSGSVSIVKDSMNGFDVMGSHTYETPVANATFSVTVTDTKPGGMTLTAKSRDHGERSRGETLGRRRPRGPLEHLQHHRHLPGRDNLQQ